MKEKIIVIVGPTGVGKTKLSLELAQDLAGEIINGDSMQVYRGLDIGTGKVTESEKAGIPHHLLDILEVQEDYSVSDFQSQGRMKIEAVASKNRLPIIVGGTGLYIESLIYDVSHGKDAQPDYEYRAKLQDLADQEGREYIWQLLNRLDPKAAAKIHPNNLVRTIRALEVYHVTGETFSSFQDEKKKGPALYQAFIIGLNTDRSKLYDRINTRVDQMVDKGLLEEVKWLKAKTKEDAQSRRGIGYREVLSYLDGDQTFEEAIRDIKQNSRHYAKRQLTWFHNRTPVDKWYDLIQDPGQLEEVIKDVKNFLEEDYIE
ncbi:tRNA dimethylallyltransferase [Alloiococcus otitis]|uniref:tRNA dimethylallyltransferase n=1 Tax=Alloiococcus otitis ATCC 51267 TaxID=883081 RepID=K9ETL2_9LACT|nr:tRNA (adenosine(37)-N6)-dimethylallyltransferase MiaA [Alloiococcus otitis]EKU94307.1 tRNA dimethylallyltransferase [Alloiococcus otitis ATCC 51267]SUU81059.1 tRNA dimethylallyltransferase [Alloiococcus otitis]